MTNFMTNLNTEIFMKSVNLAEAKTHLSELVSRAERGEETIIMRRGEAVARLVPMTAPKQRLRSRREFRNDLAQVAKPSVLLIRESRDEGCIDLPDNSLWPAVCRKRASGKHCCLIKPGVRDQQMANRICNLLAAGRHGELTGASGQLSGRISTDTLSYSVILPQTGLQHRLAFLELPGQVACRRRVHLALAANHVEREYPLDELS